MEFKAGNNLSYLSLKAGESVRGVFRGNPYEYKNHYFEDTQRSESCAGQGCKYCSTEHKPGFRFKINFIVSENGVLTAKVFEQGWRTYQALKALHESDYDLEKTQVKITRNGSGNQTNYTVTPLAKGEVTEELEKKLKEVKLNDLAPKQLVKPIEATQELVTEDIPF